MLDDVISPIDGRYFNKVADITEYFSEHALFIYRVSIELMWLTTLGDIKLFKSPANFLDIVSKIKVHSRTSEGFKRFREIENKVQHDVKAVELYIQDFLKEECDYIIPFVHFGCTSEDITNLSYAIAVKEYLLDMWSPTFQTLIMHLTKFTYAYKASPMISWTHGQPASPTTFGKEISVFKQRLYRQNYIIQAVKIRGKMGGATGTLGAHKIAYPNIDWFQITKVFVEKLGLVHNPVTTQIEPHDWMSEIFDTNARYNNICIDLCRDIWGYISRGYLIQELVENEVGSSTMPHKINPISFENAEGNLGVSNSLLKHLSEKLLISRFQRDLSDSTVLRNIGVAFAHSFLAYKEMIKGLSRISVNTEKMLKDLEEEWSVLTEAIQTVLRKNGMQNAYDIIKEKSRGRNFNKEDYIDLINSLEILEDDKHRLLTLTPATYIGISEKLADI